MQLIPRPHDAQAPFRQWGGDSDSSGHTQHSRVSDARNPSQVSSAEAATASGFSGKA